MRRRLRAIALRLRKVYGAPPAPRRLPPLDELILAKGDHFRRIFYGVPSIGAYADLRARFPTWDDVADAPLPAIARAVHRGGLGPTKAVRIRAILRALRERGIALDEQALSRVRSKALWDLLLSLPGVGPKTAACVLLFSLDRPYFPVDTHVHRVARRLGLVDERAGAVLAQEELQASVPPGEMYALHMHLIRHGREVCIARRPHCSQCALSSLCPRVGVTGAR